MSLMLLMNLMWHLFLMSQMLRLQLSFPMSHSFRLHRLNLMFLM
jgi:hypothetical protein